MTTRHTAPLSWAAWPPMSPTHAPSPTCRSRRSTTRATSTGFDPQEQLGEPGQFPYTRGVYPNMYTGRPWTMRQYAGFGTAKESNERYHELRRQRHRRAVRRLRPADPDGLRLRRGRSRSGEVGKVGVAIDSIDDMRTLFGGLPLGELSTSMTINAPAATLLLMYQLVAEENGADAVAAGRHDPERRAQGVHRPRHLHLPAEGVAAADQRHLRLLPQGASALEHHLHLRLPHGRGGGDAGAGDRLHPGQRQGVRPRRAWRPGWTSTTSRPGCRSSSSPGPRCSRRSRSSARPGGSGRGSCATSSARRTPRARCCGSTPRPPACS